MSSINKILNDALDQTLLNEGADMPGSMPVKKTVDPNEFVDAEKAKNIRDALDKDRGLIPGADDALRATLNNAKNATIAAAKNPWVQGSTAAIGAGIGALLLAKKLRAAKKKAAKKKAKA